MRFILIAVLFVLGCPGPKSAKADDAIARYEALAKQLSADSGNQTAELEGIKNELGAMRKEVGDLKKQVADLNLLLTVDAEISVPVPKAIDAPPVEKAEQRVAGPTLHGKPLDVAATIKTHYRRMWSFPGSIDSHLAEHGVKGVEGLDYETKRKLHSALHEMGLTPTKTVVKERVIAKAPIVLPMQQNCPSGNCPNVRAYGYSSRSRLFGYRR